MGLLGDIRTGRGTCFDYGAGAISPGCRIEKDLM
jgi:hypothetical protein